MQRHSTPIIIILWLRHSAKIIGRRTQWFDMKRQRAGETNLSKLSADSKREWPHWKRETSIRYATNSNRNASRGRYRSIGKSPRRRWLFNRAIPDRRLRFSAKRG